MRKFGVLCVALGALLGGGQLLAAGDRSGGIEKLPAAVRAAVAVLVGQNAVEEVDQGTTNGVLIHEVAWTADGQQHEAELTDTGDVVELEDSVPAAEVPAAVRAAAEQLIGAPATSYTRRMIVVFEASAMVDGQEREALVLPTGSVLDDDDAFEGYSLSSEDDDGEDDDGEDEDDEDEDEDDDDDEDEDDEDEDDEDDD